MYNKRALKYLEKDREKIEKAKERVEELMLKSGEPVTVPMEVDHEVQERWYGELIKWEE